MELNKLYYFHMVAKHQNVTKAAEELYISQPALTKALKVLEQQLELPLFYKKGKYIHLTLFGEYLKSQTDKIFAIWNHVCEEVENIKHENGRSIRLNLLAASSLTTDAVLEYKRKEADTIFHIIQNEAVSCDISVTTDFANYENLPPFTRQCIFTETIYLATPKNSEYDGKDAIALGEVREKGFVSLSGSRQFRVICDKFCESVGFQPNIVFESDSLATVKNIIKSGAGIGFWPEYSWSEFPLNDINLLPIRNPVCQRNLVIGLHASSFTPQVVTDFYEYLLDFIQKQSGRIKAGVGTGNGLL